MLRAVRGARHGDRVGDGFLPVAHSCQAGGGHAHRCAVGRAAAIAPALHAGRDGVCPVFQILDHERGRGTGVARIVFGVALRPAHHGTRRGLRRHHAAAGNDLLRHFVHLRSIVRHLGHIVAKRIEILRAVFKCFDRLAVFRGDLVL